MSIRPIGSTVDPVGDVRAVMQPRSIAILGFSTKPGSLGQIVFQKLRNDDFGGILHLIGRSGGEIEGYPILSSLDALPDGIDLAVFAVPAGGVLEAVEACVRRQVKAAVIFASGFADAGGAGEGEQDRIVAIARAGGLRLVGPNCLGYTNFVNGFSMGFASTQATRPLAAGTTGGVAIVAQSGGLAVHLQNGFEARGIPVSAWISTGNEADLSASDFIRYLLDDSTTQVITLYSEHLRQSEEFIAAAREAERRGKPIVLMHSGRGTKAKEAARSHTGALAGDYAVMRTVVERAGVTVVDTLDELLDVSEILARFPRPAKGGLGVLTFSGAFCGIAYDLCESIGVHVPPLSRETEAYLTPLLPPLVAPKNPLDLGTQPIWQPEIVQIGAEALLRDPAIGALAISIPGGNLRHIAHIKGIVAASSAVGKPVALAFLGDGSPLPAEILAVARDNKVVLSRSSDRTLRAMGKVLERGNRDAVSATGEPALEETFSLPELGSGPQPEWLGKEVLRAIGIVVPAGELVTTVEAAVLAASRIGYPVAIKAQAGHLAHKTEAGGVILGLTGADALQDAWDQLHANVQRAQPGIRLDGVLVEAMSRKGLELMIGARRDPQWGPVLLVGLGGIWAEALGDVRLMCADLHQEEIIIELGKLKTAVLLNGFRHTLPVDLAAVAAAVAKLGHLMMSRPDIIEVDINPLMAHPVGEGATALDALVVTLAVCDE